MDGKEFFIGRQPILDKHRNIVGYELLFRAGQVGVANVVNDTLATATIIINTLSQTGIETVLDGKMGFINVSRDLLMSDAIEVLPSNRMVLEILETVEIDQQVVDRCAALKAKGFKLALDDFLYQPGYENIFSMLEYVKCDLMVDTPESLAAIVEKFKLWPHIKLLAEKVESPQQFEFCKALNFELYQGYFFAKPIIISGRKSTPNQAALLNILKLLMNDAEVTKVEAAFKTQPDLSLGLLRLVNSVAMGLKTKIGSLHQALILLGHNQLIRWVQLLLYSSSENNSAPLMELAASRAKLMELLCGTHPDKSVQSISMRERAFMVGMLSLVGVVLGIETAEVLSQLSIEDEIAVALQNHEGFLGKLLQLAEAVEVSDFDTEWACLDQMGISASDLRNAQFAAMQWASDLKHQQS